jgi:hypothetical protein
MVIRQSLPRDRQYTLKPNTQIDRHTERQNITVTVTVTL